MSAKAFVPRGLNLAGLRSHRRLERQFRPGAPVGGARSGPSLETRALAAMIVICCRSGGMADAGDSKSPAPRGLEGSTPSSGTIRQPKDSERLPQIPTVSHCEHGGFACTLSTCAEGLRERFLT